MSATTSSSKISPPTGTARGSKAKSSKVITLKLPPSRLLAFPYEGTPLEKPAGSERPSSTSTSTPKIESPPATESGSDIKATAVAETSQTLQVPPETGKKRGIGGPKPGTKRSLGALGDGITKPRAKPGPKKRPRLDGALGTDEASRPWTTPAPLAGHKLGPKANQGAINAGLRALDRTGKPCRKWEKKSFALKSFTGVVWEIPSWRAPKKATVDINSDVGKSDTPTTTSENQVNKENSNVGSENSGNAIINDQPFSSQPPSVATPA